VFFFSFFLPASFLVVPVGDFWVWWGKRASQQTDGYLG